MSYNPNYDDEEERDLPARREEEDDGRRGGPPARRGDTVEVSADVDGERVVVGRRELFDALGDVLPEGDRSLGQPLAESFVCFVEPVAEIVDDEPLLPDALALVHEARAGLGLVLVVLLFDLVRQLITGDLDVARFGLILKDGLMRGLVIGLAAVGLHRLRDLLCIGKREPSMLHVLIKHVAKL